MKVKEIKTAEPFVDLFRIKKSTYDEVLNSIQNNGYDPNEPIYIWKEEDVLIDGHTRLKAAKEAGITDIPYLSLTFNSEEDAIEYTIRHNAMRRVVTTGDKFRCVELLDEKGEAGSKPGEARKLGKKVSSPSTEGVENEAASIKRTVKLTGVSKATVERARLIMDYCDDDTIVAVEDDEMSITKAWEMAKKIKEKIEEEKKNAKKFNRTTDSIKWALWTWNPVTGCKFGCKYCYAKDIAERFYEQGFEPTFHEERIPAPQNMPIPKVDAPGEHNVFVCSMADLFGDWVPEEWIDAVLDSIDNAPDWWNFLFLTKNPKRYLNLHLPENCWVGATATNQKEMDKSIKIFQQLNTQDVENTKFISCEPLMGPINPAIDLSCIDWLIIGGRSKSKRMPAGQPEWKWVEDLIFAAREADVKIYFKTNLTVRPEEFPGD